MTASLTDIQTLFQDHLLSGTKGIEKYLTDGGPFLKVYDHAYEARLVEVMGEDFPAVRTLLGDDGFAKVSSGYVRDNPSQARSIRWLGREFADWLRNTPPWSDIPVTADMAAFEWALGIAFDAPDAAPIDATALAVVPPDAWPALTFELHPALSAFTLSHDVAPFQQAVVREEDPEAAPEHLGDAQVWAAWRDASSLQVRYRALNPDEAAGLGVLLEGDDFQTLCEVLADFGGGDDAALRAAGYLNNWVGVGWITGISAAGMSF